MFVSKETTYLLALHRFTTDSVLRQLAYAYGVGEECLCAIQVVESKVRQRARIGAFLAAVSRQRLDLC